MFWEKATSQTGLTCFFDEEIELSDSEDERRNELKIAPLFLGCL
jgi:hypothetical protein